jgi:hypothetical protein
MNSLWAWSIRGPFSDGDEPSVPLATGNFLLVEQHRRQDVDSSLVHKAVFVGAACCCVACCDMQRHV